MNTYLKLILSTFTRQQQPNDCGLACLRSIFKYAGLKFVHVDDQNAPVSLLKLDMIAKKAGLISSCVRMDSHALNENPFPCILHILNEAGQPHFVVHYPCDLSPGFHLLGDPDRRLEFVPEDVLSKKWVSRAALYFDDLKPRKTLDVRCFPWNAFTAFRFIPKVLWLSVPFLNIVAAILGLSVTLIIQKAIDPAFVNNRRSFFILLFVLLGVISIARCLLNYLRQWLMIAIGMKIDSKLSSAFLEPAYKAFKSSAKLPVHYYMSSATDVQKIHEAVALLIGVVFSDGILVMLLFGGLYYYQPALVILQIAVFIAMLMVVDRFIPLIMIHSDQRQPSLSPLVDGGSTRGSDHLAGAEFERFSTAYFKLNDDFSRKTKTMSVIVNKINLCFDAIGSVSLVIVLLLSIVRLHAELITYEGFLMSVILCYGMGAMMSRICNQLFTIAQGADRLKQNQAHSDHTH